jgi:hypothetical protein
VVINSLFITGGEAALAPVSETCIAAIACINPALIGNIGNRGAVTLAKKNIFSRLGGEGIVLGRERAAAGGGV